MLGRKVQEHEGVSEAEAGQSRHRQVCCDLLEGGREAQRPSRSKECVVWHNVDPPAPP